MKQGMLQCKVLIISAKVKYLSLSDNLLKFQSTFCFESFLKRYSFSICSSFIIWRKNPKSHPKEVNISKVKFVDRGLPGAFLSATTYSSSTPKDEPRDGGRLPTCYTLLRSNK